MVGIALLVGPVTALLLGVAFLLDRWTLLGVMDQIEIQGASGFLAARQGPSSS